MDLLEADLLIGIYFLNLFFQLHNLIKNQKPEYLIIHLITSLPLILFQ